MADGRVHQREYRRIIEKQTEPAIWLALYGLSGFILAAWLPYRDVAIFVAIWVLFWLGYPLGLRIVQFIDMDLDKQQRTEAENNVIRFVQRRHWSYRWLLRPLLWLWLWWSHRYAERNPHRGRSHEFFVGTLDRFVHFLGGLALPTFFLLPMWLGVFAGMLVQDGSHRRLDEMTEWL